MMEDWDIDKLRSELVRFGRDSEKLLDCVELLHKKIPSLDDNHSRFKLEYELEQWKKVIRSFQIPTGTPIRHWLQEKYKTQGITTSVEQTNVSEQDLGETELLQSVEIPSDGNAHLLPKLYWRLSVCWPKWAEVVPRPFSNSSVRKWCFFCVFCDYEPSLQSLIANVKAQYGLAEGNLMDISTLDCKSLLDHYLSVEHWCSVHVLQKNGFLQGESSPLGKFFLQPNSALVCTSILDFSQKTEVFEKLKVGKQWKIGNFLVHNSAETTGCKLIMRNISHDVLLLRFEGCGFNRQLQHCLGAYSIISRDGDVITSVDRVVPSQYELAPDSAEEFQISLPIQHKLDFTLSFGVLFLITTLPASASVENVFSLPAQPLVIVFDVLSKRREAGTSFSS